MPQQDGERLNNNHRRFPNLELSIYNYSEVYFVEGKNQQQTIHLLSRYRGRSQCVA